MPLLVSLLYAKKFANQGRGSIIFWIYCGLYVFFFFIFVSHLFSKELTFETVIAPIVTGAVSFFMISFAYKTKLKHQKALKEHHEAIREDEIKKHAEAIILAEKMKKENKENN